jgi:alkanesulfonate monooxygenase SsuD/methylene tetrahydromethanopterin reductase-like flavin-dependent oxidoreductase (luciferase family)
MKVGVALPVCSWPDGRPWTFLEMAGYGIKADALGFDSIWASDHYFLEDGRSAGPDPMILLAYLAGRTSKVMLGTLVACSAFRSPGQLTREAKALAELSNGRFILGLGAGWFEPEFEAFQLPFDHRISRFGEYLEAVTALLATATVDFDGHYVRLHGGRVVGGYAPPIWIGGAGPRVLRMTTRYADGWNAGDGDSRFPELLEVVRDGESKTGRVPGAVIASRRALMLCVGPQEKQRLLADHPGVGSTTLIGDRDAIVAAAARLREAGCQHLILHFSAEVWSNYDPNQLDLAAAALDDLRSA